MTVSVAPVSPVVGWVFVPLRYCQSTKAESGLPTGISATQSVGLPGPFVIVAETVPPPATVVGVTAIAAVPALAPCTVKLVEASTV